MQSHTRSLVAACTFAVTTGRKVAGLYDHSTGADRRIAAECRDNAVQGMDGDRGVKFGGTLPEIYDTADKSFISFDVEAGEVTGYDRATSTSFAAKVMGGVVQVYDYTEAAWYAYEVQDADAASAYIPREDV